MRKIQNLTSALLASRFAQICIIALILAGSFIGGQRTLQLFLFITIAIIFTLSIYVLTGLAGEISLGHAGLMGAGAYVAAVLALRGVDAAIAIPASVAGAALIGYALSFPAGRVREFYLAMMTLGFGVVFFEVVKGWNGVTGGVIGLSDIPNASINTLLLFGISVGLRGYVRVTLLILIVVIICVDNIKRSSIGRALLAVQHTSVAVGTYGLDRVYAKRLAYVVSGALAGLAGSLYSFLIGFVSPDSFSIHKSIEVLVLAIFGGIASIPGQIISSIFFTLLPEYLGFIARYQLIIYGLVLSFCLIVMPKGLGGWLFRPARYVRSDFIGQPSTLPEREIQAPIGETVTEEGLRVKGVSIEFGGLRALDNVSLDLIPGKITALVGPNGSGKSTLVNVITGVYKPHEGEIWFGDVRLGSGSEVDVSRTGIVRTFQDPKLVPELTVLENVLLGAHSRYRASVIGTIFGSAGSRAEEKTLVVEAERIIEQLGLRDVANEPVEGLPYGVLRMTEIARALIGMPRILLLDEPAAGLSESEMQALVELLAALRDGGMTILIIEHHIELLEEVADKMFVLDSGKLIYSGTARGMREDEDVVAAYLGS